MGKRLRTVKRGVVKRELADPSSKLGIRTSQVQERLVEAASGYLKPPRKLKNAFRSDDPEAEIPQHHFRQGPDFRSSKVGYEAGYALVGASRPKLGRGGVYAPSAVLKTSQGTMEHMADADKNQREDEQLARLHVGTDQFIAPGTSKRGRRKLKKKATDHNVYRWT